MGSATLGAYHLDKRPATPEAARPEPVSGRRNRVSQPQILEQHLHLAAVIHLGAALTVAVANRHLAAFAGFRGRAGTVAALGGVAVAVVSMTMVSVSARRLNLYPLAPL